MRMYEYEDVLVSVRREEHAEKSFAFLTPVVVVAFVRFADNVLSDCRRRTGLLGYVRCIIFREVHDVGVRANGIFFRQ